MNINLLLAAVTTADQATDAGSPGFQIDLVALFQNGALVATIVCLLLGLLWTKPAYDRQVKAAEKAEAQRDDMLAVYQEKIIPTLSSVVTMLEGTKPLLADVSGSLHKTNDLLEEVRRTMEGR